MGRITLRLHPADVLIFRESRYFGVGAGASASEFPTPQTISGAIRRYMLAACGVEAKEIAAAKSHSEGFLAGLRDACGASWPVDSGLIGPFLWAARGLRHFPAPRAIVEVGDDGKLASLKPCCKAPPGWSDPHGLRPLTIGKNTKWDHLDKAYVSESELKAYLRNEGLPAEARARHLSADRHFASETRVGVGLSAETARAEEGLLYTSTFMRLKKNRALELDIDRLDDDAVDALKAHIKQRPWLTLGGERKIARVEMAKEAWTPPAAPDTGEEGRSLLYFATPTLFAEGGALPATAFGNATPIAASVGSPLAFSGWDLTRNRPLKTRYAVPAGAVYFFDKLVDKHDCCVSDDPNESQAGWGYALRGAW